ncbi:MAG: thiamine-binding protein [Synergistetes bacterium]|nr:thiamine-binding protein [Synergistota bacterium]
MVRADLRVLPCTRNKEEVIKLVDKAISVIERSGLPYEVTPTCTLIRGELSQILSLAKAIHEELIKEEITFLAWELRILEFKD